MFFFMKNTKLLPKLVPINGIKIPPILYNIFNVFVLLYYIIFYFEAKADVIFELERNYRINENIIKFITVRNDDQ